MDPLDKAIVRVEELQREVAFLKARLDKATTVFRDQERHRIANVERIAVLQHRVILADNLIADINNFLKGEGDKFLSVDPQTGELLPVLTEVIDLANRANRDVSWQIVADRRYDLLKRAVVVGSGWQAHPGDKVDVRAMREEWVRLLVEIRTELQTKKGQL